MARYFGALTLVVITCVIIDALNQPLILLFALGDPADFTTMIAPIASTWDMAASILKIVTMVLFAWWIYTAGRNLVEVGVEELDFTPAARIWWFAVPFANFVKPFEGMRELWNASRGNPQYDSNDPVLSLWWALWLLCGIGGWLISVMGAHSSAALLLFYGAVLIRAPFAIFIVQTIYTSQKRLGRAELAEVFG